MRQFRARTWLGMRVAPLDGVESFPREGGAVYCLLSKDQADLAPAEERVLPVFSGADAARAYREGRGLSLHYEVAEVPDLELLRGLLRAHSRGVLTVALDPHAGPSRAMRTEFALSDPWRAFVELLRLERASMTRGCSDGT